jgi:hypothetical protein
MVMSAPTVFPDPLKALEADAYESAAEEDGTRTYRHDYAHLGPAIYERPFRAGKLKEWPIHTDFRPEELEVKD